MRMGQVCLVLRRNRTVRFFIRERRRSGGILVLLIHNPIGSAGTARTTAGTLYRRTPWHCSIARGDLVKHLLLGRDHAFDFLAIVIVALGMHDGEGKDLAGPDRKEILKGLL